MSIGPPKKPDHDSYLSHSFDNICPEDGVYAPEGDTKFEYKVPIQAGAEFPLHPVTGQRTKWILIHR